MINVQPEVEHFHILYALKIMYETYQKVTRFCGFRKEPLVSKRIQDITQRDDKIVLISSK